MLKKLKYKRVYVEISNVCNLQCSFCPTSRRPARWMSVAEFEQITDFLKPYTSYLYFHVKGEPLLHPELSTFLKISEEKGFQVNLTSNGVLLKETEEFLLESKALRKVSISLQSFERDKKSEAYLAYMAMVRDFSKKAAQKGIFVEIRQWDYEESEITREELFHSKQVGENIYLSKGHYFEWPDLTKEEKGVNGTCHGLRQQFAILVDGTVVPCCLDQEGDIHLGNIFEERLEEILAGPKAKKIVEGFQNRKLVEPLCRTCGYIQRF